LSDRIRRWLHPSARLFRTGAELVQFALVSEAREGRIPPAYRVITRPLENESAMPPPHGAFLLPGVVVKQHRSGITETEGREDRDEGLLVEPG
jgi:hypothetical protein